MSDFRDYAHANRWWDDLELKHMRAFVIWDDDPDDTWERHGVELVHNEDADQYGFWVTFHWDVCESCGGRGTYVNPNIDRHGLTYEDFDADPDFEEMYFSGGFDVTCEECQGQRVTPAYDQGSRAGELIDSIIRDRHAMQAEREAEMRSCYGPSY